MLLLGLYALLRMQKIKLIDKELKMLKSAAVVVLCLGLGSTLYGGGSDSNHPFIGVEIGYATVQGAVANGPFLDDVNPDYKGSDIEYGIRIGAQTESWRTTLAFNFFDSNEVNAKQNYEKGLASVDYFPFYSKESSVEPYIGANVGYVNYESENNIDMSGFIYGLQAGVVFKVTENVEADLMYRYSLSNATQDDRNAELDHIGSIVFGINYVY